MDIAVVTGASSGLGLAITRKLLSLGFRVYGLGGNYQDLPLQNVEFRPIPCDLSDPGLVEHKAREILERESAVALIVNNAKLFPADSMEDGAGAEFARSLNVNLLCPLILIRAFLPGLQRVRGKVITISSATPETSRGGPAGAACAGGLRWMQESLFQQYRDYGITFSTISPEPNRWRPQDAPSPNAERPQSAIDPQAVADAVGDIVLNTRGNVATEIVLRPERLTESTLPPMREVPYPKPQPIPYTVPREQIVAEEQLDREEEDRAQLLVDVDADSRSARKPVSTSEPASENSEALKKRRRRRRGRRGDKDERDERGDRTQHPRRERKDPPRREERTDGRFQLPDRSHPRKDQEERPRREDRPREDNPRREERTEGQAQRTERKDSSEHPAPRRDQHRSPRPGLVETSSQSSDPAQSPASPETVKPESGESSFGRRRRRGRKPRPASREDRLPVSNMPRPGPIDTATPPANTEPSREPPPPSRPENEHRAPKSEKVPPTHSTPKASRPADPAPVKKVARKATTKKTPVKKVAHKAATPKPPTKAVAEKAASKPATDPAPSKATTKKVAAKKSVSKDVPAKKAAKKATKKTTTKKVARKTVESKALSKDQ